VESSGSGKERPWLALRNSLPAEVAEHWRRQMIGLSEPEHDEE